MPIVKLPGGDLRDEVRQPLYDTVDLEPTVDPRGTYRFFSDVQGRSLIKTNLRQNNLLETAVSYRVTGLALDAQNYELASQRVLPILVERSSLAMTIGEKQYWKGPTRFACGRFWQNAALAGATDRESIVQQYGDHAVQGVMYSKRHVIEIPPLQAFFCEWVIGDMNAAEAADATNTLGTRPLSFVFSLKGDLRRPVQ